MCGIKYAVSAFLSAHSSRVSNMLTKEFAIFYKTLFQETLLFRILESEFYGLCPFNSLTFIYVESCTQTSIL
jgi:hypothetical protein